MTTRVLTLVGENGLKMALESFLAGPDGVVNTEQPCSSVRRTFLLAVAKLLREAAAERPYVKSEFALALTDAEREAKGVEVFVTRFSPLANPEHVVREAPVMPLVRIARKRAVDTVAEFVNSLAHAKPPESVSLESEAGSGEDEDSDSDASKCASYSDIDRHFGRCASNLNSVLQWVLYSEWAAEKLWGLEETLTATDGRVVIDVLLEAASRELPFRVTCYRTPLPVIETVVLPEILHCEVQRRGLPPATPTTRLAVETSNKLDEFIDLHQQLLQDFNDVTTQPPPDITWLEEFTAVLSN